MMNKKLTVLSVAFAAFLLLAVPTYAVLNSSQFVSQAQDFINDNCGKKHIDGETSLLCYLFFKTGELNTKITNIQNTVTGLATTDASQSAEITSLEERVASLEAKLFSPSPSLAACIPVPSGIVSWWPGDGNANDISGTNTGTLQNGATFASGKVNQAFSFDGVNALFQSGTTGLPTGNNNRTIDLWVKINSFLADVPDPHSPLETFFVGYGNFGTSNQSYQLGTAGNVLYFSSWGGAIFGPSLHTGVWYLVAVTNEGNNVTLYLNGLPVSSGTVTINTPTNTQFYMGRISGTLGDIRKLNGLVDETEVFNHALTSGEIKAIFDAGSNGKCK